MVGLNCFRNPDYPDERKFTEKGQAGNEEKLENNICRAKQVVYELAMCNEWEYFVTFTLDKVKYDRYNLEKYKRDLSQMIRNFSNRKSDKKLKYILIPEMHKDGAWHMHGFMAGLREQDLQLFDVKDKLPAKIINRLRAGKKVYSWPEYSRRFGFSDVEKIENTKAVSKYVLKYINKEMSRSVTDLNAHLYYCSKGLKRADIVYRDILYKEIEDPEFKNEFITLKYLPDLESAKKLFEE